jgi:DNA-binding NarL/FixJ family response regulator
VKESKQSTSRRESSEGRASDIRVLLADDNNEIVDYVSEILLDSQYDVVGAITNGQDVVREAEKGRPDVLILDISMGEVSGIELARILQGRGFFGKIVFLTVHEDQDFLRAAIAAGGSAYVVKSRLDSDLLPAIHSALRGLLFVSPSLQSQDTERSA